MEVSGFAKEWSGGGAERADRVANARRGRDAAFIARATPSTASPTLAIAPGVTARGP